MTPLEAAMPKKKVDVDDPPAAFVLDDDIYEECVVTLATEECEKAKDSGCFYFKGVPVFKKSRTIDVKS